MEINLTFNNPPARIFDAMPDGWVITEGATTAPAGFIWINNGKSRFGGEYAYGLLPEDLAPCCWTCKHIALDISDGYICRKSGRVIAPRADRYEINKPRYCKEWTK